MGFDASLQTISFSITDPEDRYCGLRFRTRTMSVGEFEGFTQKLSDVAGLSVVTKPTAEELKRAVRLYEVFVPYLLDWNIEQKDAETGEMVPVPPSLEGIQRIAPELAMFIATTWMTKVVGVTPPLGGTSNAGGTSAVASIPMDVSSPSPPKSSTPS
ncbi:MAG: hypothetical protein PVJ28_00110 [Acidimicrobiia bacterium]